MPPYYRVQSGDTPTSIVSRFGAGPHWVAPLVEANGLTAQNFHVGRALQIPAALRGAPVGLGAVPSDCNAMVSSLRVSDAEKQRAIAQCQGYQAQAEGAVSAYTSEYQAAGLPPDAAQKASEKYAVAKSIVPLVNDYNGFRNWDSLNAHDRVQLVESTIVDGGALAITTIAATGVGLPIAAGLAAVIALTVLQIETIYQIADWLDGVFNHAPKYTYPPSIFCDPCNPECDDSKRMFPNGIPSGPSDARWRMPGDDARFGIPPNPARYIWTNDIDPADPFVKSTFVQFVTNSNKQANCSPSSVPDAVLLGLSIDAWNRSRYNGVPRTVRVSTDDNILRAVSHAGGLYAATVYSSLGAVITKFVDPITTTFLLMHFDFDAWLANGTVQWKDGDGTFVVLDGPDMPPPSSFRNGMLDFSAALTHGEAPTSTAAKVATTAVVTAGVGFGALALHAALSGKSFYSSAMSVAKWWSKR